ncbi:hypothetical protein LCGC14_1116030 [marine sediment metagenome]|uniref:Uncharacterized protein n=1 Tax=marine sediment metagenome TaxID=412755 RepID=A0A0F9M582_9ZZZZ
MVDFKFEVGNKVKDLVTGFSGIIIGRTDWLTGCNTYGVKSEKLKDGLPMEAEWLDEIQLKEIGKGVKIEKKNKDLGGPQVIPQRNLKGK